MPRSHKALGPLGKRAGYPEMEHILTDIFIFALFFCIGVLLSEATHRL